MNALTLAAYITIMTISIGSASASSSFITFVGIYLLWVQLANQRREGYRVIGYGVSPRWVLVLGLCAVFLVALAIFFFAAISGVEIPLALRLIPGALTLIVLGSPALRSILRSAPADVPVQRLRLSAAGRVATIVTGAMMALGIWVLSVGDEMLRPFFGLLLMLGVLGWWTVGRVSERVPALGAVWAWPQWTAFAVSSCAIVTILLLQVRGDTALLGHGDFAAGAVFCLYLGSAFLGGRDG
ncbi:hypothetical protein [Microbacterium murale]|uniref:Uncharacterized protein n=1 Tax=Microbacterium murale TaxID=1081040 RepID=A0ABQ1RSF3_9MICO|nr:hypothetical protein [Microbacterium murale]GGD80537.1 hypothetical protein GCM10007269_24240 [Microbacterium murale]